MIVLAVACTAPSALFAQVAAPATKNAGPDAKEKKICHSVQSTGSYMLQSVCHTKAEWDQIAADNKENTRQFTDRRRIQPAGMGRGGPG